MGFREYKGDAVYAAWRSGHDPDMLDDYGLKESYSAGEDAWEAAAHQFRSRGNQYEDQHDWSQLGQDMDVELWPGEEYEDEGDQ